MYIIRTFRGFLGVKDRITYWLKRDLGFLGVKEAEDTKKGGFFDLNQQGSLFIFFIHLG